MTTALAVATAAAVTTLSSQPDSRKGPTVVVGPPLPPRPWLVPRRPGSCFCYRYIAALDPRKCYTVPAAWSTCSHCHHERWTPAKEVVESSTREPPSKRVTRPSQSHEVPLAPSPDPRLATLNRGRDKAEEKDFLHHCLPCFTKGSLIISHLPHSQSPPLSSRSDQMHQLEISLTLYGTHFIRLFTKLR